MVSRFEPRAAGVKAQMLLLWHAALLPGVKIELVYMRYFYKNSKGLNIIAFQGWDSYTKSSPVIAYYVGVVGFLKRGNQEKANNK